MSLRLLVCLCLALLGRIALSADDWRQFRGTHQNGLAGDQKLPTTWDVKNIAWSAELPGRGPSSPIVVGSKVIVTASSGAAQDRLHVLAFDVESGKPAWQRQFWATGRCFTHPQSANAANTPASDGQRIFAFYSSNDLACLDLEGNLLWYRGLAHDYPKAGNDAGMSSSPVVIGDTVIAQVESQGDSFVTGLDTATGETRWLVRRPTNPNWSSPIELPAKDGKSLVLIQATAGLTALDPRSGEEVWKYEQPCDAISSASVSGSRLFVPSKGVTALDLSSEKAANFLWSENKLTPGAASPVVHEGRVYTINRAAVLHCADAENGKILWQLRLKGAFWATPVVAGDRMVLFSYEGNGLVVQLGDKKGELLATNEMGDKIQGSPAAVDGALFVRSDRHLWKISERP
jgi:outer membrane protein assembly factor BamB